jgi:hypothetical protein
MEIATLFLVALLLSGSYFARIASARARGHAADHIANLKQH